MSAESPRHVRSGGPLTVPSRPPSDRSIIDAVSGFINDVTLSSSSTVDPKDVIQWARFETADINEPTPEGDSDNDISPLLLILGYGSGVQVWLIPPTGEAQEVLSWRQGTVRVLRILPTPQHGDCFASKRPLIALCDSASPGPTFCSLSFISIRGGEQVKSIKFKNPILDVLANKRSVVVSFSERFAVFDAGTLEDRMAVTTCYPCPCPLGGNAPINPLALGDRWLAYADKKLNQSKRSSGGCEGEGVTSYTASVLHAAKSLSKGLRGFGESVAHSLAGGRTASQSPSPPNADMHQPGVVTVLDIEGLNEEDGQDNEEQFDPIVAHFVAHSEAIIALKFDASGMLLVTADRRGHDFHVFRVNPHPCGPSLASVHHLYILHRGDTTAKVQDIAISSDSRWAAVSTLRGTTHVFALSPYGGVAGVRTHTQPRVVNRLSRFHRSAGLPIHAAPKRSPVTESGAQGSWFPNPRLPPYPAPCTATPLAQLRPTANLPTHTITRTSSGRQRLSSVSEDSNSAPLLSRARFGPVSTGITGNPGTRRGPPAVAALYLMSADGSLLHVLLHPRPLSSIPKEKICDDSPIELEVEPVAQWPLQRPAAAADLLAPLPPSNPLLQPHTCRRCSDICMSEEERWLSQVEIVTHAGPHRRLWMGPQFVFKTYNLTGSNSSLSEAETVEVETGAARGVARSNPVNMPGVRPLVPVLVDSGSPSSLEHSPSDSFRRKSLLAESGRAASVCDVQLKEDLAEAMKEDHGLSREERHGASGRPGLELSVGPQGCVVRAFPRRTSTPPQPVFDPDAHTAPNRDEATFRPVVRAPAALPQRTDLPVRPLPRTTTIPVQPLCSAPTRLSPDLEPLTATVFIPAALTDLRPWSPLDALHRDVTSVSPDTSLVCEDQVSVDERQERDACHERGSAESAERACPSPTVSLPKSPRPPGDVHSARDRVKKSPTPDSRISDVGFKSKKSSKSKESGLTDSFEKGLTELQLNEAKPPEKTKASVMLEENECVESIVDACLKNGKSQGLNVSLDKEKLSELPKKDVSKDVKHSNEVKASIKVNKDKKDKIKDLKVAKVEKKLDRFVSPVDFIDREASGSLTSHKKAIWHKESSAPIKVEKYESKDPDKTTDTILEVVLPQVNLTTPMENDELKCEKESNVDEIKTEDQAWDMLLNEPDRPIFTINQSLISTDKNVEESKPKSKKNRKPKKLQDEVQAKSEEDSFVEIHAIEDKQQVSSGDLVSISTPYENLELSSSYHSKAKKVRSPKSITPERKNTNDIKADCTEETESITVKPQNNKQINEKPVDSIILTETNAKPKLNKEPIKQKLSDALQINNEEIVNTPFIVKESPKPKKNKSPYLDRRKSIDKFCETDVKDVYVIDSTKEEYPEIQITKSSKSRKKSPQSAERKPHEKEIPKEIEKPVKSWSSIAASRTIKKTVDEAIITKEFVENKNNKLEETILKCTDSDANTFAGPSVSLQDKLIELCKRTDVIIAECDTPSELIFVEEHHSVINDFPPLDMDFGLDDFKLEVMRDSLLDLNDTNLTSPICNIDIDNILSDIKESSNMVVESSSFNLIDLEKVPTKQEKGFSFVENDKITTHEVKIDDETKLDDREMEMMDKSSDDDIASPILSTDSDKDEKKSSDVLTVASLSKQSAKSKKARRKKK